MSAIVGATTSRRSFLVGAAGLLATVRLPRASADSPKPARQFTLTAAKGRASLVGKAHPETDVWCYDGGVPGPLIRARQGEPIRIVVENSLGEDTTVHWHGIRLPIAMDGVPGISQPSIASGQRFTYEFTAPDAGTFWYHPHADSLQQLGRGMAGAFIVDEPQPIAVDRDVLWMLTDWRLTAEAQIASGFGNSMALARIMALRFEGHRPLIIAIDGQPCDPHVPDGGRLLLGPAMRVDFVLDMLGEPGGRYRVVDDFYDGLAYWLTKLAYDDKPPLRAHSLDPPLALPRNPLPEPDLTTAQRHELRLQGGMMGGGAMAGMGGMSNMSHAIWAINGSSMTGDGQTGMAPLLTLQLGRSYVLTLRNDTAWWHPMHLHGHSFRVLSRNGQSVPFWQGSDTVLVPPKEAVDIAFVADNPGDWMLHCHVTDHQVSGMMAVLRIA